MFKTFKKKPKHFCSPNVYITIKIFSHADDLLYIKKIQRIKEAGSAMDSVALPITHFALCKFRKTVI